MTDKTAAALLVLLLAGCDPRMTPDEMVQAQRECASYGMGITWARYGSHSFIISYQCVPRVKTFEEVVGRQDCEVRNDACATGQTKRRQE